MKAQTWHTIYRRLEAQQDEVSQQRGKEKTSGVSAGIAVAHDDLARRWQRLARVKARVGIQFCRARDREVKHRRRGRI